MLSFGFYNSKNGDRKYDAEQIGAMFNGLITDGIFANYKEALRVTSGDGKREIVIRPGRAWFNGTWTEVDDGGHSIHLGTSFAVDDTFYICLAVSKKSRINSIAYYKNIPENNADTGLYYYLLAQVNIPAGSDRITNSMITDTRGSDLCPYVTGIMETVSFEEIVKRVCGDSWQDWLGVYEAGITTGVQNAIATSQRALKEVESMKAYAVESAAVSYIWAKFDAVPTGGGGFEWATDSVHTELSDPPVPVCLFRDLSYADLGPGFKPNISLNVPYIAEGESAVKAIPAVTQSKVWKEYPYFWEGGAALGTEALRYDDLQRVIVNVGGTASEKYRYRVSRLVHVPVTYEPGAYIGTVTADNATAYPRDGYKGGYYYMRFAATAEDVSFNSPDLSAKNVRDAIIEISRMGGSGSGTAMSVIEVEELPSTGIKGVFYIVKKPGDSDASEYLWLDRWEKVGGNVSGQNVDRGDMFGGYDRFYNSIALGRVNPDAPLDINTYDGSGQLTHPCVRHFPGGFAGHSWWMAASPYAYSNADLENPCVWHSDDGIHWSADGIPNPLALPPREGGEVVGYNSDPHLLLRPDGVMEVWWRAMYESGSNAGVEAILRRTSVDGISWTEPEELHREQGNAKMLLCPVALYEDGVYRIWVVRQQAGLCYYESADGTAWRHIRYIDVSNHDYPEYKVWHFDINNTAKGYEYVGCYNIPGDHASHKYLYYAVSQDNITYSKRVMILTQGETGSFDERLVYRPSIVRLDDRVRIYYGANNADNVWSIGFIEAPSAYLFNAVLISGARVGAIESGQEWLDGRVTALEVGGGGIDRPANDGVTVVRSFDESPWLPGYWDPNNNGALTLYSNMHRTQLVELASLTVDGELPEITATSSMAAWALVRFNYFDGNLRWIGADMGAFIDPGAGTQEPTRLTWPAGAVYVAISANTADKSAITISGVPEGSTGSGHDVYYVATNYGIRTEADDNTPALQELVDMVSAKGGGVIWFPVGIYNFKKSAERYAVVLKSNVSIVGENIDATVFKQTEASPYSMFYRMATADDPLVGCCFSNFTVDAYATGNTNKVFGKAFYAQYLRDCVFRDLRLQGTIATALGIDYLDRVAIENVNCVDCGRTYTGAQSGTSGIGIGTGGWDEENFTIANCVCVGSGQFGIFIENQHVLGWGGNVDYSKGCVISNCIVRDGLNHGIGIRGGENVTVIGCETYENAKHGIYLDNKCRNVKILDCSSTANGASGVYLNQNSASGRIVVRGCTFVENAAKGIHVSTASDKLCIANNLTDDNEVGLYIGVVELHDCVIQCNALLDDCDISASFSGNTDYNDLLESVEIVAPTAITANDVEVAEGRTASVVYTVTPSEASKDVTFVSSNTNIATVGSDGTVTGVAIGSCDITITSKLDDTVNCVVTCTVVEFAEPDKITILSSDLTVGKGIDDTGAEATKAGVGLSGYIDVVSGEAVLVTLKSFKPSVGTNLAEYDSEKNFITKKSIYVANNAVLQNEYPLSLTFTADTKYIRLAINDVTGVHKNTVCVIEPAKRVDRLTVSDLVADTKINPDGSTGTQSGAYASEYIGAPAGASKVWIAGYSYPGRLCTYDNDKSLISEYSNGMTQKVLDGAIYDVSDVSWLRFCTSASTPPGASDVIELCWV